VQVIEYMNSNIECSAVLADESGVTKTVYGLVNDNFSPVDFVDFATIIEHGVLGDIVLISGGTSVPEKMNDTIRPMLNEGIMRISDKRPPVIQIPRELAAKIPPTIESVFNSKRNRPIDSLYEAERIAGGENTLGLRALPSIRQRKMFDTVARPLTEHWICDLLTQHNKLTDAVIQFKREIELPGYIGVRIPLFANLIFKKASTLFEVYELMLEQRHACRHMREAVNELHLFLARNDVNPIKKAQEREKFLTNWSSLISTFDQSDTAIATYGNSHGRLLKQASRTIVKAVDRKPGETIEHAKKLLDMVSESINIDELNANQPWTLRPIKSAVSEYLMTADIELHAAAHRIFGISPDIYHQRMQMLVNALRTY